MLKSVTKKLKAVTQPIKDVEKEMSKVRRRMLKIQMLSVSLSKIQKKKKEQIDSKQESRVESERCVVVSLLLSSDRFRFRVRLTNKSKDRNALFLSMKRKSLAAISCLPVEGGGGSVQCLLLYTRYCLVLFVSRKRCLSICKRRLSLARCVFEALLRSALFTFKKEKSVCS